jgi:hypothetical protein
MIYHINMFFCQRINLQITRTLSFEFFSEILSEHAYDVYSSMDHYEG